MNDKDHDGGSVSAVQPPPRIDTPHAQFQDDLQSIWKDVGALSWVMDPWNGEIQCRGTRDDSATSSLADLPKALAARLPGYLRGTGRQSFQQFDVVPGPDGSPRSVLIIGFPVGSIRGTPHPPLAGVAIDVTQLKSRINELAHQALVDELTGLYNLRGFMLFAEHELKIARRRGTQCAILYVDVDGLKKINDTNGHQRGNDVLVATGQLLRHAFRECDVVARVGGDEFAVFAADVQGDADLLLRRLRKAVAELGAAGALSVSAGVGSRPPDPDLQLTELLSAADRAMYRDKFERFDRADRAVGISPEA